MDLAIPRKLSDVVDGGCSVLQFTAVTAGQDLPLEDRSRSDGIGNEETERRKKTIFWSPVFKLLRVSGKHGYHWLTEIANRKSQICQDLDKNLGHQNELAKIGLIKICIPIHKIWMRT